MRSAAVTALVVAAALLTSAGCGDDDDSVQAPEVTTDDLCRFPEQMFTGDPFPDSDAQDVAHIRGDLIPVARDRIQRWAEQLDSAEREAQRVSLNAALDALTSLESDTYRYLDRRHDNQLTERDDWPRQYVEALAAVDIDCDVTLGPLSDPTSTTAASTTTAAPAP